MKRSAPLVRKTPLRRTTPARDAKPRRRVLGRPVMPKHVRVAVWQRAGGRCDRCGIGVTFDSMEAHHRVLRKQGGPDTVENLLSLCLGCHNPGVHLHRRVAEEQGHIVRSHRDPAIVPVLRYTGRWYLPAGDVWQPTTPPEGAIP